MQSRLLVLIFIAVFLCASLGCTNMNKTQQGALSGAAVGAAAGAGIGALAGGNWKIGAAIGGAAGGALGGLYGQEQQRSSHPAR